jgi:hypothetical protein
VRCQSIKSTSEKRLHDAISQLEQAERHLFDAQTNLGHLHYILKKSNFQVPECGVQNRVQNKIKVNDCESKDIATVDLFRLISLQVTHSITLPGGNTLVIYLD